LLSCLPCLPAGRRQAGLHRDPPAGGAKVPGPDSYRDCPVRRQLTPTNFIAGPLAGIHHGIAVER